MNEIKVKTLKIEPVVIEFNKEEIEKELDKNLEKYKNLVFTEENATELRKTLAELRKGKKAVDRYRIDTKKELSKPIGEFENELKELNEKFDDVINPLVEQQDEFEKKRRAEKLEKVEKIRLEHIENYELPEEYHERVVIEDSMLTKSASLKETSGTLEFIVQKLKAEHDKKENDIQLIETTVELVNTKNDLGFSADAYVRLLEFNSVDGVKKQIELDAQNEVARREYLEKQRIEREKEAELERIAEEQQKDAPEENKTTQEPVIEERKVVEETKEVTADIEIPFSDDPFMDDPFAQVEQTFEVTYKIETTNDNLQELNEFMTAKGISFEVIE